MTFLANIIMSLVNAVILRIREGEGGERERSEITSEITSEIPQYTIQYYWPLRQYIMALRII